MMPFPSDHWRDAAAGRLVLSPDAVPKASDGDPMSVNGFTADGFGIASTLVFQLPGASVDDLGPVYGVGPSLAEDGPIVVVDAGTGERIPAWLERDWLDAAANPPVLVIRPAVALPSGARIVVGVRGLVDTAGAEVPAPDGFRALRDGEASRLRGVHTRRAHYEDQVFPVLEAQGFTRGSLQLAWDFTTRTEASATTDLATIQQRLYEIMEEGGPRYRWEQVQVVDGDPNIAVIADGIAEVPSFLAASVAGVRPLRRDADGLPVAEGIQEVAFRVQIPHAAVAATEPSPVLQYGHGFLGTRDEANNGWLREMAQRHGFVILAADMQGMSTLNAAPWGLILTQDAGRMQELSDEPMQGLANHLALQRLIKGSMQDEGLPQLRRADGGVVFDRDRLWYHGNSQGGTMGTLVLALSRDVQRGGLGVPGCCFPLLLNRSVAFEDWAGPLASVYPGPGDLSLILSLLGTGWDRLEGLTWAPFVVDPLPFTPEHQALLHVGLEDAQVLNEASWTLGRRMGAVQPADQVAFAWGMEPTALPARAPAVLVNWDFGVAPDATPLDPPVKETDTHSGPRELHEAQDQLVHFLRTGEVIDLCGGGPCVFAD
jgi:hypothetical protein